VVGGTARHPWDHDVHEVHDVIGVGLGPFNLGLAALLAPVEGVDAVFFEARPEFSWHPGLLLDGTTLQVPFLADLVTLADPTNPYSFLNYLHCSSRLYRFYFYERFHVPRKEYDAYCRWVAEQLPSCRFGHRVVEVRPGTGDTWVVRADDEEHRARAVVFGVGSTPVLPPCAGDDVVGPDVFHSADYLARRDRALGAERVTVVGSGQSAAEVFADLLAAPGHRELHWYTRSRGFLPMEYSKLGLEHFTPEYTAYFHGLPEARRDELRSGQDLLYKGIDAETGEQIYDALYEASIGGQDAPVTYRPACELREVERRPDGSLRLALHHLDQDEGFAHDTDVVVLATGYEPAPLPVDPEILALDAGGRPVVELDYRLRLHPTVRPKSTLFVQNGELHTHGVGAPDLGLGAHRNSVIVNAVAGREVYPVRERNVFQSFGVPQR
jgi:lysine N6-hydroxylase